MTVGLLAASALSCGGPGAPALYDERQALRFQCGTRPYSIAARWGVSPDSNPEAITRAIDADVDSRGTVFVLDRDRAVVSRFASNGQPLGPLRDGDSLIPAANAGALALSRDSVLYVWYPSWQLVVSYSPSGQRLSSFSVFGSPAYGAPSPMVADDSGRIGMLLTDTDEGGQPTEIVRLVSANGAIVGQLGPFATRSTIIARTPRTVSRVTLPLDLSDRTQWAMTPDGAQILAPSRAYRLVLLQGGDTVGRLDRDVASTALHHDDVTTALVLSGTTGISATAVRQLLPPAKSTVLEVVATTRWLLVRRPTPGPHFRYGLYDVYSREPLGFCATLALPARLLAGRDGYLVGLRYYDGGKTGVQLFSIGLVERS